MSSATFYITNTADDGVVYENATTTFNQEEIRAGATLGTFAWAGYRFRNITIPAGATIITALFTPSYVSANGANPGIIGNWKAVNSANAALFTNTNPRAASKLATGAVAIVQSQTDYEMKDALQAVINLGGWASGNSVAFVSDNVTSATGASIYADFTGGFPTGTASLYVEWEVVLSDLTLSNNETFDNASNDEIVGILSGQTDGSSLSISSPDGNYFKVVSNRLEIINGPPPVGSYDIVITETLAGASNSPKTNAFTITVVEAPPVRFVGAATGTNSATIPSHQAGDAILAFTMRDGSLVAPTIPSQGWDTLLAPAAGSTLTMRLTGKIADSSSEVTGTFTNATSLVLHVYRPKSGYTLSFGAAASATAASTTITIPALSLENPDGTSWSVAFAGHRSTNTSLETAPTGLTARSNVQDATDEAAGYDTNGGVSSWSQVTRNVGGTSSGWFGCAVELRVTGGAPEPTRLPSSYSFIIS